MFNKVFPLLLLTAYCSSCETYKPVSKAWWLTKESYNENDTLYVKDFVFCFSRKEPDDDIFFYFPRKRMSSTNADSVFTVFTSALHKLNLPMHVMSDSKNRCDASFHRQYPPRLWKINRKRINEIANLGENKAVLLPFIRIDQSWRINVRGHPAITSNLQKTTWLHVIILVVMNQEVIYRKHYSFSQNDVFEDFEGMHVSYPYSELEQIHWDNLVRLAMEDYMKRVK